MNMQKDDSSFGIGMKPFVYSVKKNREAGTNEWGRGGFDVRYYKNHLKTMDRECAVSVIALYDKLCLFMCSLTMIGTMR